MLDEKRVGVTLSYLTMAVNILAGIIYVPLLLQTIGQKEYGLYQLIGGMTAYVSLFDFGLSNTVTRFYVKYKLEGDKVKLENMLSISRFLFWGLTAICLCVMLALYFNLQLVFPKLETSQIADGKIMFILLMISFCATIPTYVYTAVSNAEEKFIFLKGMTLLSAVLQPICVILMVMEHPSAVTVTAVAATLNVILCIIKILYVKLHLKTKFKYHGMDKALIKSLFAFSIFIFINTVVDQINWQVGKTIFGIMNGDTALLAVLSIGMQLGNYYVMFSSNVNSVFYAKINRSVILDPSMENANDIFKKVGRIQALILGLVLTGFIVFGQEFINIWAGAQNRDAYFITVALMAVLFLPMCENTGILILQAKNIHKWRSLVYLILSAINIVLCVLLIPRLGVYGAMIGTVVSFFIGNNVIINFIYKFKAKIKIEKLLLSLLRFIITIAVLAVPAYFVNRLILVDTYYMLLVKIIVYILLYCLLVWLTYMDKFEKGLVGGTIKKIFSLLGRMFKVKKKKPVAVSDGTKDDLPSADADIKALPDNFAKNDSGDLTASDTQLQKAEDNIEDLVQTENFKADNFSSANENETMSVSDANENEAKSVPVSEDKGIENDERDLAKTEDIRHIVAEDKTKCCGCGACVAVCPQNCITMQEDKEGFLYPSVDTDKCVNCGLCKKVCLYNSDIGKNDKAEVYACCNLDDEVRLQSSSGGVFSAIAKKIINDGGAVYGCAFDVADGAKHIRVDNIDDLAILYGSKYAQSDTGAVFGQVKEDLNLGKKVLFSGTPCQINGLKSYLNGIDDKNLVLADVICHGVPSKLLYKYYVDYIELKAKKKVKTLSFRDKTAGWEKYGIKIGFEDGTSAVVPSEKNYFMKVFLSDIMLRPACYKCVSKDNHCLSDFTMGDYWGADEKFGDLNDGKGLSVLIVRTQKGAKLFDEIKDSLTYKPSDIEDAIKHNKALICSATQKAGRQKFVVDLKVTDFDRLAKVWTRQPLYKRIKNFLWKLKNRLSKGGKKKKETNETK